MLPTDEAHIDGDKKNNGLRKQNSHRTAQVSNYELLEVDFNFLLFGVYAPVLRSSSQLRGLCDQDDWRVRLLHEE